MDASKRLVNIFYAAATILAWMTFSKLFSTVFQTVGMRDAHLLGKQFTMSTLFAAGLALVTLFWAWHSKYRALSYEVADELVKVTWPNWEETRNHTKVTIITTVLIAFILWLFDQVFGNLTNLILGG